MTCLTQKALHWVSSALLLSISAKAESVETTIPMFIQQNQFTTMGIGLPFPSSAGDETTRAYSGNFSTSIKFDNQTLEIEGFKFNGGAILTSAYGLLFQEFVTYPSPYNTLSSVVTKIPVQNNAANGVIRYSPETRENGDGEVEYGEVDSEGQLRNLDHKLYADQGAYQTWNAITGTAQDVRIDNYFSGVDLFYNGTSTVEFHEVSSTIYARTVYASLTIELDETDYSTLQGNVPRLDLQIIETEVGTVISNTASFNVPTNYGYWAIDNDLVDPNPDDLNEAGIPYSILFALDLPVDAASLPISIENGISGPIAKITLPEGGLNNPMSVEYTTDLSIGDWPALPEMHYLDGPDSLDLGATGEPTFGFPAGDLGFIRFVTVLE